MDPDLEFDSLCLWQDSFEGKPPSFSLSPSPPSLDKEPPVRHLQLPEDIVALILAPEHFDTVQESVHASRVCRAWYPYGQRLLWNRGLRAELGTVAIQQQLEAFLDQPKIRPLVKRLNILLNNTAIGSDARAERLVETKMHVEDIAERLGELKELKFVATKNARDLADLLDDAIYPDLTQLFPHLTKLTFASHPVGSGPATETGHLNVCATTLVNQMHWWSSLYSFTSMGVLYEHIPDGVVPLPLTHLVFGVKEEVSPMLDYFLASTKATLTSFTLATKDALIVEVLSTLCAPDWHLKRLSVAAKSPSTLFNVGIPEGAPNYTIFEAFTPVLVALPTLEVLILGHNNAPDQPRLDLNAISFWGHSLDIPEFWAALPSTLTTLGIGCIAGRRAKGMMDYLTREEGQRAPLRLLKFRASEGRAVGFRCEELGIRFELEEPMLDGPNLGGRLKRSAVSVM